jgi:hypothetical protein
LALLLDVPTLMAMRVSELLCERTGLEVSPWCFPLGHPDESSGPFEIVSYAQDWRDAVAAMARDPMVPNLGITKVP